jgi:putative hydrolase of the HAD superfamily
VPADKMQQVIDLDKQSNLGMLDQSDYEAAIAELAGLSVVDVHDGLIASFGRNEALLEYVQELRKKYKIGMLSNIGKDDIKNYFSSEELLHYFDAVILSSDVGMMKPYSEAFWATCEKLGVDSTETIMIDDVLENVVGAELAGLYGIHYEGFSRMKAQLENLLSNS